MMDGQARQRAMNEAIKIDMTARAVARSVNAETAQLQRQVAYLRGRLIGARPGMDQTPALITTAHEVLEQIDQALRDFDARCAQLEPDVRRSSRLVDSRQALLSAHRNLREALIAGNNRPRLAFAEPARFREKRT